MAYLDAKCSCELGLSTCDYPPASPFYPADRDDTKWIAIAYCTCIACVAILATYAFIRSVLPPQTAGWGAGSPPCGSAAHIFPAVRLLYLLLS